MIDVRFQIGNLGYRLRVRQDRYRGGYEAVLTTDDGAPLMMPNGTSPGDAIARLVRELTAGDTFDRKIAKEIVQRTGFPDAFPGAFAGPAKTSHATVKDLSAVEDALGWTPEPDVVERAEAKYSDYSTNELRQEIRSLEDQFEMAGGRGVSLADRLDAARIALALRGSKTSKGSHATKRSSQRKRSHATTKAPSSASKIYYAAEFDLAKGERTGVVMEFVAEDIQEAAQHPVYTLNLKSKGWKVSPSGKTVQKMTGDIGWHLVKAGTPAASHRGLD